METLSDSTFNVCVICLSTDYILHLNYAGTIDGKHYAIMILS